MTDFLDDDNDDGTDLVSNLRKANKAKDKDFKELKEQFEALAKKDRTRSLGDALRAHNVPEKVAKFYPSDKDASEDSIKAWLSENADVFGIKLDAPPADEPDAPKVPDGLSRLQAISTPSMSETGDAALLHQINQATTADELTAMILAAGGGAVS